MSITFLLSHALNCLYTQPICSCLTDLQRQSPVSLVHFAGTLFFPLAKNLMFHTGYTHGSLTPKANKIVIYLVTNMLASYTKQQFSLLLVNICFV